MFSNFWSHSLGPRLRGSMQLHGSSTPDGIISSHPIPTLLELETLLLMNSILMLQEVQRSVDGGLSAL